MNPLSVEATSVFHSLQITNTAAGKTELKVTLPRNLTE
jgi:hypothetical protein